VWLLPALAPIGTAVTRLFYRGRTTGGRVPALGPVLLVANHPNSLVDPAVVAAVAGRPVRFLAKAPLFRDPVVGWMVRGAGSIPVHRAADGALDASSNEAAFGEVHRALAGGAAVGIFPEGLSHDHPAMTPLRTGAARMALGAAALRGGAFPIVPVGLVFREKGVFRSESLAVVGKPVAWDDLAARGSDDAAAVRELTARIGDALAAVTVNLERWEDAPLVETAEAVFTAELGADGNPAARIARVAGAAAVLARLRRDRAGDWETLAREVRGHGRMLRLLRMTPEQLRADVGWAEAGRWTLRQLGPRQLLLPAIALGIAVFWLPYRLTGVLERRARPDPDLRGSWKILVGTLLHAAWIGVLAAAATVAGGWVAGVAALLLLPPLAVLTPYVLERSTAAAEEARRFVVRRTRRETIAALRARQRALAERLQEAWSPSGSP
jgi:glycerol-3-phosphate O-acyltransferase / dihydroxyacetone phosphate acyltransferase